MVAKRGFTLLALCVAVATALDAQVTFVQPDGSATQVPQKITLPQAGQCTDCVVLDAAQQLKPANLGDQNVTPVLLSVEAAPGGTAVAFIGFGSNDCTGTNQTSYFTDFQTNSVAVSNDSVFPGSVLSFLLCLESSARGGAPAAPAANATSPAP